MSTKRNILIIGGGTAGWMTANLFAKRWAGKEFNITLIEADDIPTIGVGEGSTPYIKRLFKQLEIPESKWMPKCGATYKNGIAFSGWTDKPDYESYFHPFIMDLDKLHFPTYKQHILMRHQGVNIKAHPDDYFVMSKLTELNRLPFSNKHVSFNTHYAYHFDSGLLSEFLKEHAINQGIKHINAKISKVEMHPSGDIAALYSATGQRFEGDVFVDCTGFRALLINKTLNVPFISFKDNLFNDAAVALPSVVDKNAKPHTLSVAMSNGWRWQIPLTHKTGNGYVYSSQHLSSEHAEQELRRTLGNKILDVEARHIKMRVGRSQKHWEKNCLAVGLSQGFIEPLEATALQLVQVTIEQFIEQYERGDYTNRYQEYFNNGVNNMFEHLRDYIVLHYLANTRKDTQYWRDCRGDIAISDSLRCILETWSAGADIEKELVRQNIIQYYPSVSWHVILAGMGVFPLIRDYDSDQTKIAQQSLRQVQSYIQECLMHFPERNDTNEHK